MYYYLLYSLNALLMILMPLALGWLVARRHSVSWTLFGIGAATFILSQVAHVPFNFFFFKAIGEWLTGLTEARRLVVTAVLLGVSAGVFEEGSRYLTYRYWAKDARTWGSGLMLGAGHGGAEAIILGLLAGINFVVLSAMQAGYLTNVVPPEQKLLVDDLLTGVFSAAWYDTILGAAERFFALGLHLALSLLILQVFVRRHIVWLFVAIAWHAAVDAVAVYSIATWGTYVTEGLVGLFALVSVAIVFWLREPEKTQAPVEPLPRVGPADPMEITVTAEKLDESRFI